MKPLLDVTELNKTFHRRGQPDFTAINNVSFQVFKQEILGIVGESGSGKSTIAKIVSRLINATRGSIRFEGEEITNIKGKELRRINRKIQMVFQSPVSSFNPRRTLGDGIGESLRNSGATRAKAAERTAELLKECGLSVEFAKRYPHQVSGGQCQRAAIARALAIRPKLLICDEATSALDATVQKQMIELLLSLQKSTGMSYIFICHNLALVQQFCNRVLVLHDGKIVEEGMPDDVIIHPKSVYTKQLVEAVL